MIRRMICIILSLLLLCSVSSASAGKRVRHVHSYDFDLTFSLNAEAFPRALQSRMSGYAALVNRLGIRGNISWTDRKSKAMEINATLYFTDRDSVTYPFRIFGVPVRMFITSSLIQDEVLFLNMPGLMAFSSKARSTLNIPLSYLAILWPYATSHAFKAVTDTWLHSVGSAQESRTVSLESLSDFSIRLEELLLDNQPLQNWIRAVAEGARSQDAVEAVFSDLPYYYHLITGDRDLAVEISAGSETWKNAGGKTLYSRTETDHSFSMKLSLPAESYGYKPFFSFSRETGDQSVSFDCRASLTRKAASASAGENKEMPGEDEDYEEESDGGQSWPDCLLDVHATGSGIPRALPSDSSFSVTAAINGAVYPNFAFLLQGETKNDGSVTVELYKPSSGDSDPAKIFSCSGTILPGEAKKIPNYRKYDFYKTYNVFSFNEGSLGEFNRNVLPSLVMSILSFVEEAPVSACQSLLDDLTEMGVLDMLLN